VNEHKLVLQDFVETYAGRRIMTAAASKLAMNPDRLQRLVADLPRFDLYFPFKQHRQTWEGTPDLLVAVVYEEDAPTISAVAVDGSVTTLRLADGVPRLPLLIMHPEEAKLRRENPQTDARGRVVQDVTDGTVAAVTVPPGVDANGLTVWLSANRAGNAPTSASQSSMVSGIYINHFNVQEGDGWFGDSEMQFHSTALDGPIEDWGIFPPYNNPGVYGLCPLGTYYRNGVEEDVGYNGLFSLSPGITDVNGSIVKSCDADGLDQAWYGIAIKEDDSGLNGGNDDFGWHFYYGYAPTAVYPWGARLGTTTADVVSFYVNTWGSETPPANNGARSAYLRIQYY
jgi:hypothetical protein